MASVNTLPLEQIAESPFNPRKSFDKDELAKLADSIKELGVLQPILVRPMMIGKLAGVAPYECVFGHRRLRAAKLAGLEHIPASVRELDDKQTLEAQLVENLHRVDVHPLEEGAAYHELHTKLGYTVDEIAAKVGKSVGTIHARMKLCALCEPAREALLEGRLLASVAVLIARIPNEQLQLEATKNLLGQTSIDSEPVSFRYAASMVQRDYMLRLAGAPFDIKSETLLPDAGACSSCPKRSGAQPELFGDVDSADICTDPTCYAKKLDAAWKLRAAAAKTTGQKVLSEKESKKIFSSDYSDAPSYDCGLKDVDQQEYVNGKYFGIRQLAKKAGKELEVVLARDRKGNIRELVDKKAADALVRAASKKEQHDREERHPVSAAQKAENEKWKREREERELVDEKATIEVVKALENGEGTDQGWVTVLHTLLEWSYGAADVVAKRRGLADAVDLQKELRTLLLECSDERRLALLAEVAMGDGGPGVELVKACGVDVKAIKAEVKAEMKAKAKEAEDAALIKWTEAKDGDKGKGGDGRQYKITKTRLGFDLKHTGNNASKVGTGAGGSGPYASMADARASALQHEKAYRKTTSPASKKAKTKAPRPEYSDSDSSGNGVKDDDGGAL
jgi:ParB/RepB/Spo0J family partition protein